MKKESLLLLINTVLLIVVSIVFLVIYTNNVPKTPEDKLFNQVVEFRNTVVIEQIPADGNYSVIATRSRALDNAGDQIGLVYKGVIRNNYAYQPSDDHGLIEILVGITPEERVFVQIVTLRQTSSFIGGIQDYVYEYYRDIDYLEIENLPVEDVDLDASATATDSTGAIKALVQRIVDYHFEIVRDPYEAWYGAGYTKANDDGFVSGNPLVIGREVIRNANDAIIGYVYELTDTGVYYAPDTGSVTAYIAFDIDNVVIGVMLPEETYGHSLGNFRNKNLTYLESFIGATAEEFAALQVDNADIAAGASNTQALIDRLLVALSEVITG